MPPSLLAKPVPALDLADAVAAPGGAPRESPAHLLRQPIARQPRILTDARSNPRKALRGFKLLMRRQGLHDPNATSSTPPCPEAFTGNDQDLIRPSTPF